MKVLRGEIVIVDFPYAAGGGTKVRPALVVQNDRDNQRLTNTVVVQITSRAGEVGRLLNGLSRSLAKQ